MGVSRPSTFCPARAYYPYFNIRGATGTAQSDSNRNENRIKGKARPGAQAAVIGEEASLDEASRPELAVIKRFALATSLRIEEIVTLSWPQVDWENREAR